MTRDNSPNYAAGAADALSDNARVAEHGGYALGPTPPNPDYPVMYMKGYQEHFAPIEHVCTDQCRGK